MSNLDRAMASIIRAADEGRRCPENGTQDIRSDLMGTLARAGTILIEIYERNYRVVTILTGPHAGKRTAGFRPGVKPWKVVGTVTRVNGKICDRAQQAREQRAAAPQPHAPIDQRRAPSAPRPLTQSELDE